MATTGSSSNAAAPDTDRAAVDLVVGLVPSSRPEADTSKLVRDLASSLSMRGPDLRWRLVLATSGAIGGLGRLRDAIGVGGDLAEVPYALQPSDSLDVPYHGMPGRARALRAILEDAQAQAARACVVIDPRSVAPASWIDQLVHPVMAEDVDFVAPVYHRHPFTGALVHGLVYPTFRALYGAQVRYPIGPDFGCSPRLIEAVLPDPIWEADRGQLGIDVWLSATAVSNGFRTGQAFLGPRLEERAGLDLGTTMSQVVGFFFADMERRANFWQRVRGPQPLSHFGTAPSAPRAPDVDVATVADSFRLGSRELKDVWAEVLPPLAILQWRRLAAAPLEAFRVDDGLWARTVYDFAVGHRQRVIARDHLLRALTPLYLGWLASFVLEVRGEPAEVAEARIDRLCLAFEVEKPYLISQWRWPERFKPVKLRR